MIVAVIALSLLPGLPRSDVKIERLRSGPWRIEVKDDRFTHQKHCTASQHGVVFDHGVVTFSFSRGTDTANALFRVDNGELRTAASVAVEAVGLGANFQTGNFENPSNGEVHIPLSALNAVAVIEIKPNAKAPPRSFKLGGLPAAISAMQSRGCIVG